MTLRRIFASAAVLLLLPLVGCGESDGEPNPAGDPAAVPPEVGSADCPLTADEVAEVVGREMSESGDCDFRASDGSFIEVYVARAGAEVFGADEPATVEGVGDEAYRGPSGELYVLFGDAGYQIHVMSDEPGTGVQGDTAEVELARKISRATG